MGARVRGSFLNFRQKRSVAGESRVGTTLGNGLNVTALRTMGPESSRSLFFIAHRS
jgi:hypothetical protein